MKKTQPILTDGLCFFGLLSVPGGAPTAEPAAGGGRRFQNGDTVVSAERAVCIRVIAPGVRAREDGFHGEEHIRDRNAPACGAKKKAAGAILQDRPRGRVGDRTEYGF